MSASKVYFTDMRCPVGTGLLDKLKKLIEKAGIDSIDMDSKFVAIKIHFGEPGNLSFLRPNFAKVVADKVTSLGGRPFLTDCNTLYVGRRKHALEHLAAAQENGFSPLSTGCQMIIADGLKGTDEMEVPLEGCDHFQSAFIGRAIMDADIFISLTHFKGHELTGFGGAIKNIGMGCGSRAGKMAMHSIGKPSIDAEKCRGCKTCTHYCAQSAISIGEDHKARIDHDLCAGCGRCIGVCNCELSRKLRISVTIVENGPMPIFLFGMFFALRISPPEQGSAKRRGACQSRHNPRLFFRYFSASSRAVNRLRLMS